jgi:hypothetical protein
MAIGKWGQASRLDLQAELLKDDRSKGPKPKNDRTRDQLIVAVKKKEKGK